MVRFHPYVSLKEYLLKHIVDELEESLNNTQGKILELSEIEGSTPFGVFHKYFTTALNCGTRSDAELFRTPHTVDGR